MNREGGVVRWLMVLAFVFALPAMARAQDDEELEPDQISAKLYTTKVKPIFESRCYGCHGPKKQKGEYRLDTKEGAFKGAGTELPDIVPGDAMRSNLVRSITLYEAHDDHMPPDGKEQLTPEEILVIINWIDYGAVWPGGDSNSGRAQGTVAIARKDPLAESVSPADPRAMERLREIGALAMPVASNTNWLSVDFLRVADKITDAQLAALEGIAPQLAWLNLANTRITDKGMAFLAALPKLTRLHLENTAVSDAGLSHLESMGNLEYLNLYGTRVSDAGLDHLAGLKNLRRVYLWQTKVTPAGKARLERAISGLQANTGEALKILPPKPIKPEPAALKTVNAKCPITGRLVNPKCTFKYKNERIGFCCPNCLKKFGANPAAFIAKVKRTR